MLIVGVGSGLGYAANGPTHHSCEDFAVLRALPNMALLAPADAWELRSLMVGALERPGPAYLRMGKKGEPLVHASRPALEIGRAFSMKTGTDVALLCTGTLMPEVLEAAAQLESSGISTAVFSMHTVKPLDEALLAKLFVSMKLVVTIEEHSRIGGLGGSVAEWRADHVEHGARLLRLGTPDEFLHHSGEQEHARAACGLTSAAMADCVKFRIQN